MGVRTKGGVQKLESSTMSAQRSFVKKTKAGRVMKVVREHYLRDDIYVGCELATEEYRGPDPSAWKLSAGASKFVVIDTNVALHQLDFLAHKSIADVVVLSVVLEECRNRSKSSYDRLRAMCQDPTKRFFVFANEHHRDTYIKAEPGESPNDRNDRAIRVAAKFYRRAIPSKRIVLLTNDRGNLLRAKEEGVDALSVRQFAKEHAGDAPELMDLVAGNDIDTEDASKDAATDDAPSAKRVKTAGPSSKTGGSGRGAIFTEHLSASQTAAGIKGGTLHQGSLRTGRFSPWEGYVGSDAVGGDIMIVGRTDMNRAMDGDVVAVELLPESEWRAPGTKLAKPGEEHKDSEKEKGENETETVSLAPAVAEDADDTSGPAKAGREDGVVPTGKVVGIVKRNWRERGYAACIDLGPGAAGAAASKAAQDATTAAARSSRLLAVPQDRRLPKIRIQTRQAAALVDQRIVVVIDSWPCDSPYPEGHYVKSLGKLGDVGAETAAVLLEADVDDRPFAPAVHACVPPLPWCFDQQVHLQAQPHREDLRSLRVCSVDPPGCRDIDDALSCRPLDEEGMPGMLELGVHIADVTSFLHPDTAMDDEAKRRGTTTYLVQRRLDMLPKPLTEDICSLRGGVERLTFSVFFRFNAETGLPVEGVAPRFTKAVIKSAAALTYAEAQHMMDDPNDASPLANDLRNINACARSLRKRRIDAGALTLASPEVRFEMDKETNQPLDVGMYVTREANQMVEEMMLLANVASAERILRAFPSYALLRRHPTPAPRMFDPLLKACRAVGVECDVSTSKKLADSLDAAVRPDDAYFNTLLRIVATRCMSQAVYCVSGAHSVNERVHYGLAAPLYTHFTSPIRRYADVVVHRLLNAALGLERAHTSLQDSEALKAVADNINVRHRNSQMAARASVELHTHIFFRKKAAETEARVIRVRANGLIVFVPKFGIEAPVLFDEGEDEGGKKAVLDEEAMTVTTKAGKTWKVFDACVVRIEIEELAAGRSRLAIKIL